MALAPLIRRLGEALVAAAAPPRSAALTTGHFTSLGKLVGALPVGDLVALIEGRASVDTVIDLAEEAARIVGAAFPPAAITAAEVAFGLEALQFVLHVAGFGASPFRISPGQNPLRGGFEGARGHI